MRALAEAVVTQQATARRDPDSHQTRQPREKRISLGAERAISTPTGSRIFAESSGDTAVEENSGPNSGPVGVASDLDEMVRLLGELPDGQRQALVSLFRRAAGSGDR